LHPPLGIPPVVFRQVRPRPFDVGTLDPDLRLMDLRNVSPEPYADIGDVFDHVRSDASIGQDAADEVRFDVTHGVECGERIAESHDVFLPGGSESFLPPARPTCFPSC